MDINLYIYIDISKAKKIRSFIYNVSYILRSIYIFIYNEIYYIYLDDDDEMEMRML